VCLILVALLAVMQIPHLHQTPSDAEHCALCVVMHSAAPVTVADGQPFEPPRAVCGDQQKSPRIASAGRRRTRRSPMTTLPCASNYSLHRHAPPL
jgi:hypothetical protein